MLLALQNFQGERPLVNQRLLKANEAQTARNVKLWDGKLRPWFPPKLETLTGIDGTFGIYRYKDKYWLRWEDDVNVVRGPIAGTDRLYWTGEGAPRLGNLEVIAGITTLTVKALAGQSVIFLNNVDAFEVNDPIEIQLDSGTHTSSVNSIDSAAKTVTIAAALPSGSSAAIGNLFVNTSTDYPHSSYLLGVPAPASVLSAVTQDNKGTVVSFDNFIAEASGTATTLDLSVTGDGTLIEFKIFAKVSGDMFGVQSKDVTITVTRDPGGDDEEIFELTKTITVQGALAGQRVHFVDASKFSWSTDRDKDAYIFRFAGAEETVTYRLAIADGFVPANLSGGPSTKVYELSLTARYAGRLDITIAPSTHALKEGDKVQFAGVKGTETLNDINKDEVSILSVDGDVLSVDSQAFGSYTSGGTWEQVWDEEDLATRNYVYTYVATLDGKEMEGPPSNASAQLNVGDNQPVLVSGIVDPSTLSDGRPYSAIRIYRVAVGTVAEEYLFVAEVELTASTYTDLIRGTALGEVLPSLTWDVPPDDLTNIIELPNGVLAAIRRNSNEVLFSEPFQPHAWPTKYRRSVHDEAVSIAAFGASIVVGTKGRPTLMTGSAPDNLSEEHIETIHPCLSKRGMVDMGYAVLYPSKTGLVMVTVGLADVVTHGLFSSDDWLDLNPSSFVAARYDDRYICFYDNGKEKAGFVLDPKNPGSSLTFIDLWARDAWSDPETGELFLVLPKKDGTEEIVAWNEDRSGIPQMFRWRSKEFVSARPVMMSVVKVDADNYPVKVNLFMDGQLFDTMDVYDSDPVRCNDELGKGRLWEVEIIGDTDVDAVYVAPNMDTLTRYYSGVA